MEEIKIHKFEIQSAKQVLKTLEVEFAAAEDALEIARDRLRAMRESV